MCALIALGYVTSSEKDLAIFLLVIAVGINSSTYLGFQVRFVFRSVHTKCKHKYHDDGVYIHEIFMEL